MAGIEGVAQFTKGINTGTISGAFAGILPKLFLLGKIAMWLIVAIIGGVAVYKYWFQYNIRVTIVRKKGNGFDFARDVGKVVLENDGRTKIQLMKTRKNKQLACSFPIPKDVHLCKLGSRDHYTMFLDDNKELHPFSIDLAGPKDPKVKKAGLTKQTWDAIFAVKPQERDAWHRKENQSLIDKFAQKDKLLQYAAPAILMTACITAFLIFFFGAKELGNSMSNLVGVFQQVAASCTSLGG